MPMSPVRGLLQRIDRCNNNCIAISGEVNPEEVADLIESALEEPKQRRAIILGIATYVASCMGGVVPDL